MVESTTRQKLSMVNEKLGKLEHAMEYMDYLYSFLCSYLEASLKSAPLPHNPLIQEWQDNLIPEPEPGVVVDMLPQTYGPPQPTIMSAAALKENSLAAAAAINEKASIAASAAANTASRGSNHSQQQSVVNIAPGLSMQWKERGDGYTVNPTSSVVVHYIGTLADGTVFDSSEGKPPYHFLLGFGQVVAGLEQALVYLREGDKVIISMESDWGYGDDGIEDVVPPNATLKYDLELLEARDSEQ